MLSEQHTTVKTNTREYEDAYTTTSNETRMKNVFFLYIASCSPSGKSIFLLYCKTLNYHLQQLYFKGHISDMEYNGLPGGINVKWTTLDRQLDNTSRVALSFTVSSGQSHSDDGNIVPQGCRYVTCNLLYIIGCLQHPLKFAEMRLQSLSLSWKALVLVWNCVYVSFVYDQTRARCVQRYGHSDLLWFVEWFL